MIVVVEGVSGSGKTTWCRTHHPQRTIPEAAPPPNVLDRRERPAEAARFWQESDLRRWASAVGREARWGLVVCDTDPFRLHYAWCLWQIGELGEDHWRREAAIAGKSFASERLGLADLVLVGEEAWPTPRSRGPNAGLPERLRKPLRDWYRALERLEPARVVWGFPEGGLAQEHLAVGRRQRRSGSGLFERLLGELEKDGGLSVQGDSRLTLPPPPDGPKAGH